MVMKVAGLFAGIGGIELGFQRALGSSVSTELLCEWWDPAKRVLGDRFPDTPLHSDVRDLGDLPSSLDVLAAGFPCTDLSQAGRTAGIRGAQSGLVSHVFELLDRRAKQNGKLPTVLIENVPNMLSLDKGEAMRYLVASLEELGYQWAYRIVDARSTGLPQRRRRVILVASTEIDPKSVLFSDESGPRPVEDYSSDAFGFYWTEGRGGLGWAPDAVPTLKGGSTIGIPSPPAIWIPAMEDPSNSIVTPHIEDAEALQGFPRGWTDSEFGSSKSRSLGARWKMVGNAVNTRVAEWVASRLAKPGDTVCPSIPWAKNGRWPVAAAGGAGKREQIEASEFPVNYPYEHLLQVVDLSRSKSLSLRAISGFNRRLQQGNLGHYPGFRQAVVENELSYSNLGVMGAAK